VPVFCELCPKVFRFPAASLFICVPKCSVFLQRPYLFVSQSVLFSCSVLIYLCPKVFRFSAAFLFMCVLSRYVGMWCAFCLAKCSNFLQRPYLFVFQSVPFFCSVPVYVCVVKIRRNVLRLSPWFLVAVSKELYVIPCPFHGTFIS